MTNRSQSSDTAQSSDLVAVNRAVTASNKSANQKSLVMESLMLGRSMKETAELVGVGRSTIYEWLKNDPAFRAAYNEWQNTVQHNARGRLLALTDIAIDTVANAVAKGDSKLGMELLTKMKMFDATPVDRPTNAGEAKQEMDLEEMRRRIRHEIEQMNLKAEKDQAEFNRDAWEPTGGKKEGEKAITKKAANGGRNGENS
jgi:hypothetical protein